MRSPLHVLRQLVAPAVLLAALALPSASASAQSLSCNPNCLVNPTPVAIASYPAQLVVNKGFESNTGWSGWHNYYSPNHVRCGAQSMYLAGSAVGATPTTIGDGGDIGQRLSIPAGASGAGTNLDFWLYFPNQSTEYEELTVRAVDVAQIPPLITGNPIPWVNLTTVNNRLLAKNAWQHVGPISMAQFAGQTILLELRARTDLQYNEVSQQNPIVLENGFYLDDVVIWTPGLHINMC